jgi:anti-sigma factor RsiW
MNLACHDRERVFRDGTAEEWAALEQHAATCPACAEEIRAWRALSTAAEEMRDYREDHQLWARIENTLKEKEKQQAGRRGFREKLGFLGGLALGWQTALAGALVVALAVCGFYVYRHGHASDPRTARLLKNSTLAEVERTERDYVKAIDHLAEEAKPELDSTATPLMASYKEKLLVLDSAIDELRLEAGRNPSNAHLRYQLLAMYQEKQETLQEILEMKR